MQMEQIRSSGMFSGWRAIGGAVSDVMVVVVQCIVRWEVDE